MATAKRPMPSRDELRDWRDYIETSQLVNSLIGAQLLQSAGISTADYAVMLVLSEASDRTLRASKLADEMAWDRSRLSHQLGRMEKRALIRRAKCPEDSRGSLVTLTDAGQSLFRSASVDTARRTRVLYRSAHARTVDSAWRGIRCLAHPHQPAPRRHSRLSERCPGVIHAIRSVYDRRHHARPAHGVHDVRARAHHEYCAPRPEGR